MDNITKLFLIYWFLSIKLKSLVKVFIEICNFITVTINIIRIIIDFFVKF